MEHHELCCSLVSNHYTNQSTRHYSLSLSLSDSVLQTEMEMKLAAAVLTARRHVEVGGSKLHGGGRDSSSVSSQRPHSSYFPFSSSSMKLLVMKINDVPHVLLNLFFSLLFLTSLMEVQNYVLARSVWMIIFFSKRLINLLM